MRSFLKNDAPALKTIIVEASVGTYDGDGHGAWSVVSTNRQEVPVLLLVSAQHFLEHLFCFNYAVVPEDGSGGSEKCLVLK